MIWFTFLYGTLIFSRNIWTDEAFTLQLLKENVSGILSGTAADVHPPFYYLYAKIFWEIWEESLIAQKIATILPMTGTLVLGATKIRQEFGSRVSFLYLLFLTCLPCTMEFSVQVRMYSLALFLVTVSGLYAYKAFFSGKKKDFLVFAVSGCLAAYSHYFAFVSVIILTGFFFLSILVWNRKRLAAWAVSAAGMILGYLPWVPYFIRQVVNVESGYWIPPITAETIWSYFTWTFDLELLPGTVYGFLLLLAAAGIFNLLQIRKKEKEGIYALLAMLVPAVTAASGIIASVWKTPIYRDQYILPALGLLALFFGIAFKKAKGWMIVVASAFLLVVGAVQYKESFRQEYRNSYIDDTEAFFEENLEEGDYILYNWQTFDFIYECYFEKERMAYVGDFDFSQDFHTVWFLHTVWEAEIPQETIDAYGLEVEDMGVFGIEHNTFNIYKVYKR